MECKPKLVAHGVMVITKQTKVLCLVYTSRQHFNIEVTLSSLEFPKSPIMGLSQIRIESLFGLEMGVTVDLSSGCSLV